MSAERETLEYQSAELVDGILKEWVQQAATVALASGSSTEREKGFLDGVRQMRHLHLAEPWLVRGEIFKALKLAGWTPPEGYLLVDYSEGSAA